MAHSVKLLVCDRDGIISRAVSHGIDKEMNRLRKEEDAICRALYRLFVKPAHVKAADKLPAGWVEYRSSFSFNVNGESRDFRLMEPVRKSKVETEDERVKRWRAHHLPGTHSRLGTVTTAQHPEIVARIKTLTKDTDAMKARQADIRAQVRALVHSVTTTARLREVWPEGAQFYEHLERRGNPHQLPAMPIQALNEMLGLRAAA